MYKVFNTAALASLKEGDKIRVVSLRPHNDTNLEEPKICTVFLWRGFPAIKDGAGDTLTTASQGEDNCLGGVYSMDNFGDQHEYELIEEPPTSSDFDMRIVHTDPILIKPHGNGGWTIEIGYPGTGQRPFEFGAYTNADDLMEGLKDYIENGND